jgi:hypothetical protein
MTINAQKSTQENLSKKIYCEKESADFTYRQPTSIHCINQRCA